MAAPSQVPRFVQEVLPRFRSGLEAHFGQRLLSLRLFGSAARGQMHEESDVDVLVLLDQASWADRRAVLDVAGALSLETGLDLSPTVIDRARYETWREQERPLVMDVERQGVAF